MVRGNQKLKIKMKTKIWNCAPPFDSKVNFVDSNNVILGYDMGQYCCENAFWTISESKDGLNPIHTGLTNVPQEIELDGYIFDKDFLEMQENGNSDMDDYQDTAIFKLISCDKNKPDLYIKLENHHNGYYSHGFIFRGETTFESCL